MSRQVTRVVAPRSHLALRILFLGSVAILAIAGARYLLGPEALGASPFEDRQQADGGTDAFQVTHREAKPVRLADMTIVARSGGGTVVMPLKETLRDPDAVWPAGEPLCSQETSVCNLPPGSLRDARFQLQGRPLAVLPLDGTQGASQKA